MDPNADPRKKDGALHVIGTLAQPLLKVRFNQQELLCDPSFITSFSTSPSLSSEAGVQGPDGAHVTKLCVSSAQL